MSSTTVDQFRFMDLPAEVRQMVYIQLFSMTNFSIVHPRMDPNGTLIKVPCGMAILYVSEFIFEDCWQLLYQYSTFHHRHAWLGHIADFNIKKSQWGYDHFSSAPGFLRARMQHVKLWAQNACRVILDPDWNRAFNVLYPNVETVEFEWVWWPAQRRRMSGFQAFIHGTQSFDWKMTIIRENRWGFHSWMVVIAPRRLVRVCRSSRYGTKRIVKFLELLGFDVDTDQTPIEDIDGLYAQR